MIGGDQNERYILPRITFDQDYTATSTHHEWLVLTVRFTSILLLPGYSGTRLVFPNC